MWTTHKETIALIKKGDDYRYGINELKDEEMAFDLYNKANWKLDSFEERCVGISPYVCIRLGECYLNGIGTGKDFTEAFYFLLKCKHYLDCLPRVYTVCKIQEDPNRERMEAYVQALLSQLNEEFKKIGFVVCLEDNRVIILSKFRVPFQINAEKHPNLVLLKDCIFQVLKFLPKLYRKSVLHARYGTTDTQKEFYDLENVLFYNFGFPKENFQWILSSGMAFSRMTKSEIKKIQKEKHIAEKFCHCYEYFADSKPQVSGDRENLICEWDFQSFISINSSKGVFDYWKAMKYCSDKINTYGSIDTNSKKHFSLYLEIEKPKGKKMYVLGSLKPLLDAIVSSMHGGDFSDQEILLFSKKLNVPSEWLKNTALNILGKRKYIQQYPSRSGLKWNPADDLCDKVSVSIFEGNDWRIKGRVYEITPYCPNCGKSKIAKIIYGMPAYTKELQKDIDEGRVVLAGCMIENDTPSYFCRWCKTKF